MKSSYSQNSMYVNCSRAWDWAYTHKLRPEIEGASLFFGTAVDSSVMHMLEGKADYIAVFKDRWTKAYQYGKSTPIFDNSNVAYSYNDFDADVLQAKDKDQLLLWAAELNVGDGPSGIKIYKEIVKIKKNPYKRITDAQLKYFNRVCWLSLKRKGEILIESFKEQFYPKIKRVLATQKYVKLEVGEDVISGYVDMILEIEGEDKPVIFDLKTAAQPYTQDQIDLTEQLTLYQAMSNKEFNTDRVGYVVLCKNIPKEVKAVCKTCNHTRDGRHKTCNNIINEARCGGEWLEKKVLKPEVQVLIETKSPAQVADLMQDYSNIMFGMKHKVVFKNTNKCHNWWGAKCPYFNACHKNDFTGLKKG